MAQINWFSAETWQLPRPVWAIVIATFAAIAVTITTAPKAPVAAGVFAAAPLLVLLFWQHRLLPRPLAPAIVAACLCWLFAAVSVLWSADIFWSAKALALSGLIIVAIHLAQRTYPSMPTLWLEHMTRTVLVAFIIFLIYGLIEETFNHQFKRVLFWPFQAIQFKDGALAIDWQHVTYVRVRRTNWNMTNTSFLLWPALLVAYCHFAQHTMRWFVPVAIAATIATVLQSHHETAMIALLCGVVFYGLAHIWLRPTIIVAAAAWFLAIALVVPISHYGLHNKLHLAPWVPFTLQHRLVMWGYTADRVIERPVLGVGAGSTHPLDAARESEWKTIDNTPFQLRTGAHPHNSFLQVWYEFGAIGALLFLALGWTTLWTVAQRPRREAVLMTACFINVLVMSTASFGLFELWYASTIALLPMLFALANAYQQRLGIDQ